MRALLESGSNEVLIADRDPDLSRKVESYLAEHGLQTRFARTGRELQRQIAVREPSLVLLDLHLPPDDGLDVLRKLRASSDLPVIITTQHRVAEADRVVALELGADDYVTKPFGLRDLLARVRAVLRRSRVCRCHASRVQHPIGYRFKGAELDCEHRTLRDSTGHVVTLTRGEFDLLLAFLAAPQTLLARERLLRAIRVREDINDRSIDVRVLRLRRKLSQLAGRLIRAERSGGYVFDAPVEPVWSHRQQGEVHRAEASRADRAP